MLTIVSVEKEELIRLLKEAYPPLAIENLDLQSLIAEIEGIAADDLREFGELREINLDFYGSPARSSDGLLIDFSDCVEVDTGDEDHREGETFTDIFSQEEMEGIWE